MAGAILLSCIDVSWVPSIHSFYRARLGTRERLPYQVVDSTNGASFPALGAQKFSYDVSNGPNHSGHHICSNRQL
jgi:hypothetical protein